MDDVYVSLHSTAAIGHMTNGLWHLQLMGCKNRPYPPSAMKRGLVQVKSVLFQRVLTPIQVASGGSFIVVSPSNSRIKLRLGVPCFFSNLSSSNVVMFSNYKYFKF